MSTELGAPAVAPVRSRRRLRSHGEGAYAFSAYFIVGMVALVSVIPFVYILGNSITSKSELAQKLFVIWPTHPTLDGYLKLIYNSQIKHAFFISVLRATIGPVATLIVTSLTAFALSRRYLPGKKILTIMFLITILFSASLVPTFLVIQKAGLTNKFWVYIIPAMLDGFGILVVKQFMENIDYEIIEATIMDGASHFQLLARVMLPLSKPVLAAMWMFQLVWHWNSWFDVLVYVNNPNLLPLQYVLRNLLTTIHQGYGPGTSVIYQASSYSITRQAGTDTIRMAAVVLSIVPILLIYPFLQKYFVKGMYLGAIKG